MGDHADDMMAPYERYGTAFCSIHQEEYINDEWGCRGCENGDPPKLRTGLRVFRPHQKTMAAYCMSPRFLKLLWVDMRLGKTLVTVRSVKHYKGNILVVGPYSVMKAWRKELAAEGIKWTELFGTGEERRAALPKLKGWVFTNKEIWKSAPGISKIKWGHRIIDESTFIKNPFAKVTTFFNSWQPEIADWRLSGTPNPESDLDFYGQTKGIWPQETFYSWRGYWFAPYGKNWAVKPALKKKFHTFLAKNCLFMSRADAGLDVRRIYEQRIIRFTPQMKKIYRKLAREFILEIPEGEQWETEFAGVKYSWLKRLCGGALPAPDGSIRGYWDGKLNELLDLLRGEFKGQRVVIWAHFKEEIERIAEFLAPHGRVAYIHGDVPPKKRDKIVEAFQEGRLDWTVGQAICLAHSTDYSCADTMIYYSSTESAEIRKQSERRIELSDKNTPSLIIDLVVENSIDEVIATSLVKKESRAVMTREIVNSLKLELGVA